jgi:hypothetical protein
MVQRCERFGFALEAGQSFGIPDKCVRRHFDGDLPIEVGVGGAVDLAL